MDDHHHPRPAAIHAGTGAMIWRRALRIGVVLAVAIFTGASSCSGGSTVRPLPPPVGPPAIVDSQPATEAPLFVGAKTFTNALPKLLPAGPTLTTVRFDGANSGAADTEGPLGQSPITGSDQTAMTPPLLWDHRGGLTAGCQAELAPGITKACLASVDPATFAVTARWAPPGQDLTVAHASVDDQQRVLVTTRQNHVLVVQRPEDAGSQFRLVREVDVSASLGAVEVLRGASEDRRGNLWFVASAPGGTAAATTTIGYVAPSDQVAVTRIADQVVENDLAVGQDNVFVVTAPAGAGTTGYLYNLTASGGPVQTQIQITWREPYDAGTAAKPGGPARGSGTPVVLLGSRYIVIADNADSQVHLLVFAQAALPRLVCQVPLFTAGASAVNAAPIGYDSDSGDSVIVANGFRAPPAVPAGDINGSLNSMGDMAPGLTRVDVAADGSACQASWTAAVKMKTGPLLSTASGLVYGYGQDEQRAARGSYVWYFVAIDYRTGRIAWQQRIGAGGTKNDNHLPLSLGPDGTLYQSLAQGVAWMRDVAQHR